MKANGSVSTFDITQSKDPGEAQLIARMGQGDKEAFCELFSKYEKQLYGTAFRITRNSDDAWDALQEAYLNVFRKFHCFRSDASVSTWLTRIVMNCCFMQLRRQRTRPTVSFDDSECDGPTWAETIPNGMPDAEEEFLELEATELLDEAMKTLQPKLECVLRSYRSGDHTMIELAEHCGITVSAAKSRMLRGRLALRKFGERLELNRQRRPSTSRSSR